MTQQPTTGNKAPSVEDLNRRKFMQRILNMSIGLWAVTGMTGLGYVAGRYVWPHEEVAVTGAEGAVVVPLSDLEKQPLVKILLQGKAVGIYQYDGVPHATSLICTHLGCIVDWRPESGDFLCPCHGSMFDHNGAVLRGPAPRPLRQYNARMADDAIIIT